MCNSLPNSVNDSMNGSRVVHWGNGREWKGMEGNGREVRGETSIHVVTSLTRATATAWMGKSR